MTLVHEVGYGSPAFDLLARLVADAQALDALAPVTVVVAGQHEALATRRALGARRPVANVAVLTPAGVARWRRRWSRPAGPSRPTR